MKASYTVREQLLLHKRFDQLTTEEQAQVDLDAVTYTQQRRILLQSKALLHPIPPPVDGLAALQAHYQQHYPSVVPFWQRSLPLYQVGLLALGLITLVYWCRPTPPPIVQEKIVYQTQVDTILKVQEKIVVQKKIVYQTQTVRVIERDTVYLPIVDRQKFYQEKKPATILATQPQSKSMKDMQGLLDFVGVAE